MTDRQRSRTVRRCAPRLPLGVPGTYAVALAAAGQRCVCVGECEQSHQQTRSGTGSRRSADGRCPTIHTTTDPLHLVAGAMLCDPCHAGVDRVMARARRESTAAELAAVALPLFEMGQ